MIQLILRNLVYLFLNDHRLLSLNILKREDEPPVEAPCPIHGAIVNVCFLNIALVTEPPVNIFTLSETVESETSNHVSL